jgi:hypothetical protein
MWAKLNDAENSIEQLIQHPKTMIINGTTYPRQIFQWTDAELKAIGIVPVTTTGTSLDKNYYIEKDESHAISSDKKSVIKTIGIKDSDRKLADEDATDESGNKLKDVDGNQLINYGLKTNAKNKATTHANSLLQGFDWLIQRKVTADTAIPSAVTTYMANIRTDHGNICTAIDNASDLDAFIALHNDTFKEDGTVDVVARVNRWTADTNVKQYRR